MSACECRQFSSSSNITSESSSSSSSSRSNRAVVKTWVNRAVVKTWVNNFRIGVKVKVAQSCPTPCDLMDYTVHGILQARILEWVAFPFSSRSSQPRD